MSDRLARMRESLRDEEVRSISRRYFISNGFDGTLTSIGVIVGAYLSGVTEGFTVVTIGVGGAIGLGTSGVWSVWEIERAEKQAELMRIEDAMLTDLEGTVLEQRQDTARVINAVMSGIGPLIGILLPLLPFVFQGVALTMFDATMLGVGIGVAILFLFGAYLGSISKQRWLVAGIRMALAGLVVAAINVAIS